MSDPASYRAREEPLSHEFLAHILEQFWPPIIAMESSVLQGGYSGLVHGVRTAEGPDVIVKLYPQHPPWKMAKEAFVSERLAEDPALPVPRFLGIFPDGRMTAEDCAVMTWLPGASLREVEAGLPAEDLHTLYVQAGAVLRRMHAFPMEAFGYLAGRELVHVSTTNRGYMDAMFRQKLGDFRAHGGDGDLAAAMARRWDERAHLLDACTSPVLCHNDFHPGNLLADPGPEGWRISGLLDFENAFAGDPLSDLAKTVHFARAGDGLRWTALLEGYGPTDRAHFEETIDLYRLYQTLELWDWVTMLGDREGWAPNLLRDLKALSMD